MYSRIHLQTGTLDTTGFGESSLTQVAVVYHDDTTAKPPQPQQDPGQIPDAGQQEVKEQTPTDDDPSRDLDPATPEHTPDRTPDHSADDDPDRTPPVENDPGADKERPHTGRSGARRTKAAG